MIPHRIRKLFHRPHCPRCGKRARRLVLERYCPEQGRHFRFVCDPCHEAIRALSKETAPGR